MRCTGVTFEKPRSRQSLQARGHLPPVSHSVRKGAARQELVLPVGAPVTGCASLPHSSAQPAAVKLKEEDFPSLSSSAAPIIPPGMSMTYMATAKKTAFQEEDFPALVSKMRPNNKTVTNITSAWNNGSSKSVVKAISNPCVNQVAKKPASLSSTKGSKKSNKLSQSDEEDSGIGLTTQEIRNTPTMFDVSSLLAASTSQTFTKVSKKKKMGVEKQRPSSPHLLHETSFPRASAEKLPEAEQTSTAPSALHAPDRAAAVMNGHVEKSLATCSTPKEPPGLKKPPATPKCPLPQEDFPALGSSGPARMPPPPGEHCGARPALLGVAWRAVVCG